MPTDLYRDGDGVKWITRERETASFVRQLNLPIEQ